MYNNNSPIVKKTIYVQQDLVDAIKEEARKNHRAFTAQVTYDMELLYATRSEESEDESQ